MYSYFCLVCFPSRTPSNIAFTNNQTIVSPDGLFPTNQKPFASISNSNHLAQAKTKPISRTDHVQNITTFTGAAPWKTSNALHNLTARFAYLLTINQ